MTLERAKEIVAERDNYLRSEAFDPMDPHDGFGDIRISTPEEFDRAEEVIRASRDQATLIAEAKIKYANEIGLIAARYAEERSFGFFADMEPNEAMEREAAAINVSRRYEPEAWARIDAQQHAAMLEANNGDAL